MHRGPPGNPLLCTCGRSRMIWLIDLVVTGVVAIGGLKHHYSDEPGDDEIAPGHSARTPGPVAGIQLPDRSLRPDEISAVRHRIYDTAEAWNFQPRGLVLPPSAPPNRSSLSATAGSPFCASPFELGGIGNRVVRAMAGAAGMCRRSPDPADDC